MPPEEGRPSAGQDEAWQRQQEPTSWGRELELATGGRFRALREMSTGVSSVGSPVGVPLAGRVSVVCPTTDERTLFHPQLYACFCAQTWLDKELIIVDTGAAPSAYLCRRAAEDGRVIYRHYKVEPAATWTVGLKRNLAAFLSSGEFLAHFDDDDFYAPCYLDRMVMALGAADAATLSSWLVVDACTGAVAYVTPGETGNRGGIPGRSEGVIFGYGFTYIYRRECAMAHPFPHEHFGEDIRFMSAILASPCTRGVRTPRDEDGIVLHVQQGTNISNSHASHQISWEALMHTPVARLPDIQPFVKRCRLTKLALISEQDAALSSPFLSVGDPVQEVLRPTPCLREVAMRRLLRALGVATRAPGDTPGCVWPSWRGLDGEHDAVASCSVRWRSQAVTHHLQEPGRVFSMQQRFPHGVNLPGDVPRSTPAERPALLYLARLLLGHRPWGHLGVRPDPDRCGGTLADVLCEGWVRLRLKRLSHIAIAMQCLLFARYFPCVRIDVCFDEEGAIEDPNFFNRRAVLRLLAQRQAYQRCD